MALSSPASRPPPVLSRRERAKKSIELDVCLSVWELVLAGPEFPLLKDFSEFLRGAKVPVVTKDMWSQVNLETQNIEREREREEQDGICFAGAINKNGEHFVFS